MTASRIGRYEILRPLGRGAMGIVYLALDPQIDRTIALKTIRFDDAGGSFNRDEAKARFLKEARISGRLQHPNIVTVFDVGDDQGTLYLAMEYVSGGSLSQKLGIPGALSVSDRVRIVAEVADALAHAHERGVIHRDIKPANIMITTHGLAKLMDFGIAKSTIDMQLTRPGTTMGSMYYMSPEQVRGDGVDARSDIYSFGVTLYEMVTGKKPFDSETSFSVLNAHVNEAPTPPVQMNPELPKALNDIVLCAMAKNPADRFQSAEEFRNALKALREPQREQVPQAAPPPVRIPAPVPVSMNEAEPAPQATQAGGSPCRHLGSGFSRQSRIRFRRRPPRMLRRQRRMAMYRLPRLPRRPGRTPARVIADCGSWRAL